MTEPLRRALIDADRISSNVELLRGLAPADHTLVVVKANGYGHGAVTAARSALGGGADWLGVADITEALELRAAGIDAPVLAWLHGPTEDFREAVEAGVTIGASSLAHLEALAQCENPAVHLKIDTGLGRNGVGRDDASDFLACAAELHHAGRIRVEGLMSHCSGTSREADLSQEEQFEVSLTELRGLGVDPEFRHLAASAASLDHPSLRHSMVRFGIAAYGLAPADHLRNTGVRPAMRLETNVISAKKLREGDGVSYNHLWRATESTTVALIPVGYADGIPRAATGKAHVAINGERFPVVGRIAMDQLIVNVAGADVSVGDVVSVWGDPVDGTPHPDEWADWADTIGYEIVTRLGHRVTRIPA
ncbi:MAG: alanine racemase [Microbacteriaceae bacterium]